MDSNAPHAGVDASGQRDAGHAWGDLRERPDSTGGGAGSEGARRGLYGGGGGVNCRKGVRYFTGRWYATR